MIEPQQFTLDLPSDSEIENRIRDVGATYVAISRLIVARGWRPECQPKLPEQGELE